MTGIEKRYIADLAASAGRLMNVIINGYYDNSLTGVGVRENAQTAREYIEKILKEVEGKE